MGNLKKLTKGDISGGVCAEIERTPETEREFNHETHNIDKDRTHLNYSFTNRDISAQEYIEKRLDEVYVYGRNSKRTDIVEVGSWVWTLPEEFKDRDDEFKRNFFKLIFDYCAARFGLENIAYAQVHMDETTPHMHIGIIPIVHDLKKDRDKLCAKEVFTKEYLQNAHSDLEIYMEDRLGEDVPLINGRSLGVDGIREYKAAKELTKTVAALDQEITEKKELLTQLDQEIQEKQGILTKLNEKIRVLKEKAESVIEHFSEHPNFYKMFLKWLKPNSTREERQQVLDKYERHLEYVRSMDDGLSR